jgi:hypothetical protein
MVVVVVVDERRTTDNERRRNFGQCRNGKNGRPSTLCVSDVQLELSFFFLFEVGPFTNKTLNRSLMAP